MPAPEHTDPGLSAWAEIERRARPLPAADIPISSTTAANGSQFWQRGAWAAGLLGLSLLLWQPWGLDDGSGSLRGDAAALPAVWLVPNPAESSAALATELRALGAAVEVSRDAKGWQLVIAAPAGEAAARVDVRLQALEFGLDAQGRLALRVESAQR